MLVRILLNHNNMFKLDASNQPTVTQFKMQQVCTDPEMSMTGLPVYSVLTLTLFRLKRVERPGVCSTCIQRTEASELMQSSNMPKAV